MLITPLKTCGCQSPPQPPQHPNTLNQSLASRRFINLLMTRVPELQYFARHQGNPCKAGRYQAAIAAVYRLSENHQRGLPPCPKAMRLLSRIYPEPQIQDGFMVLQNEAAMRSLAHLDSNRIQCGGVRVLVHFGAGDRRHANAPMLRYPYGKAIGYTSPHGHPTMAYVGDDRTQQKIYKVYKTNGDGIVQDVVAMLGFPTATDAKIAYLADNPRTTFGGIQPCTKETL